MMTRVSSPPSAVIRRVASRPSIRGIRMSISTMSGLVRRTAETASTPSSASATTSMPSAARIIRNPVRTSDWSSAITARRLMPCVHGIRALIR